MVYFRLCVFHHNLKKKGSDYYAAGGKAFTDVRWVPSVQTRHLGRTAPVEKLQVFSVLRASPTAGLRREARGGLEG